MICHSIYLFKYIFTINYIHNYSVQVTCGYLFNFLYHQHLWSCLSVKEENLKCRYYRDDKFIFLSLEFMRFLINFVCLILLS